jgi:hypothetical protein
MFKHRLIIAIALFAVLASGSLTSARASGAAESPKPRFTAHVDNQWFPLIPGTRYVYVGVKDGKPARDVVTIAHRTKVIDGAPCVVVEDRLFLGGRLHERTTDWYSQDEKGNVWYFGEQTAELDQQGRVKSREGSFQSGRDGARAGLFMPADPRIGQSFEQEHYKGHAEDHFRVAGLFETITAPHVKNALLTEEWTPLEPGVLDHKLYARGIGLTVEQSVKGGNERLELVSVRAGS